MKIFHSLLQKSIFNFCSFLPIFSLKSLFFILLYQNRSKSLSSWSCSSEISKISFSDKNLTFSLKIWHFHLDFRFKNFLAASQFGARVQWRSIRNWRTASWWVCPQRSPPTPFTISSGTFKNVKKIYDHYHAEDFHKIILLVKIYWRRK